MKGVSLRVFFCFIGFFCLSIFFFPSSGNAASSLSKFFLDVPVSHPHFFAISELQKDGVISGYADETFHPDQKISRAEALKVLLSGSKISVPKTIEIPPFPDVPASEWFAPYVSEAKSKNIIRGKNGELFDPTSPINKAEALKMIVLTKEIPIKETSEAPYSDTPADQWFTPYFKVAADRGIFDAGKTDSVSPEKELTRGELVEIMYRFRQYEIQITSARVGIATWYSGLQEEGKSEYTAAHREIEKGTKVMVTDYATGKSVVVRINDRGPFGVGRILDLSKKAFGTISDPSKGVSLVEFDTISEGTPEGPMKKTSEAPKSEAKISATFWNGITLDNDFYPVVRKGETVVFRGKSSSSKVTVDFSDQTSSFPTQFSAAVKDGRFEIPVFFGDGGTIKLGMYPLEAEKAKIASVKVFEGKEEGPENTDANPIPKNFHTEIIDGNPVLKWDDAQNNVFHIRFRQNERIKNLYTFGKNELVIPRSALDGFSRGAIFVTLQGAASSAYDSLHLKTPFSGMASLTLVASEHYPSIPNEKLSFSSFPQTISPNGTINIKGTSAIENEPTTATVILPNGESKDLPLQKSGKTFSLSLPTSQTGTFVIEFSAKDGIAIAILPILSEGLTPVLPDFFDLHPHQQSKKVTDEKTAREEGFTLINEFRKANGLPSLVRNEKLDQLAQFRAEDMRDRSYFGHVSPDGKNANDLRVGFAIKTTVSENIAHDSDVYEASYGLSISATHRQNLLDPNLINVGIGVANTKDGGVNLVQIYAEKPFSENEIAGFRKKGLEILAERRNGQAFLSDVFLDGAATAWSEIMAEKGEVKLNFSTGESYKKIYEKAGLTKSTKWIADAFMQREEIESFFREDSPSITELVESKTIGSIGIGFSLSPEGILFVTIVGEGK